MKRQWSATAGKTRGTTNLLNRVLALKQYPPGDELGEYTADAPHVDGGGVVFGTHQNFRRPVVLGHHFLRHVFGFVRFFNSGQTEVAYLQAHRKPSIMYFKHIT